MIFKYKVIQKQKDTLTEWLRSVRANHLLCAQAKFTIRKHVYGYDNIVKNTWITISLTT